MEEILWQLKMDARVLKYQIGHGDEKQGETQARMEGLIQLIRNKKNCGRGEAVSQETPPTAVGSYPFCRIITENGPHRSRFEGDSNG